MAVQQPQNGAAAAVVPPKDEQVFYRPDIVQWWVQTMNGQPMDENLVHRYLCESPFFDWTSKNGLLITQSRTDAATFELTLNRQRFEDTIRRRAGTEYMIVGEPKLVADAELAAQGVKTGVWVIRFQDRQRAREAGSLRAPGVTLDGQWELTTLATYYIVGERMYQAATVADNIGNRLLAASANLNKFMSITAKLPRYNSSRGYSYLPASGKPASSKPTSGSPGHSREGSVVPGGESQSLRSSSVLPESQTSPVSPATDIQDIRLVMESLNMAIQYGDEYLDENPLQGEPGALKFTSTTTAVKRRRADEDAAAARARAEKDASSNNNTGASNAKAETKPHSQPAIFSESKTASKPDKASKEERRAGKLGEKAKRRKSRPNTANVGPSPSTPGGQPSGSS